MDNTSFERGVVDGGYPAVEIIEEGMREGMQIEDASISVDQKLMLLDALSMTGLKTIVVGSFVSPSWTPQMAHIDELVSRFTPTPGVTYTALALNERGRERMRQYPVLRDPEDVPRTLVHLCDVFVRRNTNRSQQDEIDGWGEVIERAVSSGATTAGIAINAAWGSNWLGPFDENERMSLLERQYEQWRAAGIAVDRVWIGDPMGWNMPHAVASQLRTIRQRWPEITRFHLHLHDARGTALLSAYEALRTLGPECTLVLDSSVGGMGGCPYGGHGRMTRMIPTEDLVDLLEELGIPTGVDRDRLIEAALLAEEVVGHSLWGHVSKAGPRPRGARLFAMDLPFIETEREAQHFRLGREAYAGARAPWRAPIESPARARAEALLDEPGNNTAPVTRDQDV
ncbi:MAG: beta/alpha barrel domain-containing protein [Acidimicrobiales bacterium]